MGEQCEEHEESVKSVLQRKVSVGGTIRHNVSTAQLLSEEGHAELLKWATTQEGPWKEDLAEYPGPVNAGRDDHLYGSGEPYGPEIGGFQCALYRNEYLAWCAGLQLPVGHPDEGKKSNDLSMLAVHGGVATHPYLPRCLTFDCNHARTDL
eukprot:3187651-Amphidinium_carterae.1